MNIYQSKVGAVLSFLYFLTAAWVVQDDLKCRGGGWINLCGLATTVVTLPSSATVGLLLEELGAPPVKFSNPGIIGVSQIVMHVIICAALVYLLGYVVERVVRYVAAKK